MAEIEAYLVNNRCFLGSRDRSTTKGVLIHSTATPGAMPQGFVKSWNVPSPGGRTVCVHGFCDDRDVYVTLPYDRRCWGSGAHETTKKQDGNDYYVQLEMCEPAEVYFASSWVYKTKDFVKTKGFIERQMGVVALWAARVLYGYGIRKVTKDTVTSHYEMHDKGMASNHGDPKGYLALAGKTMDDLRNMVSVELSKLLKGGGDDVKEGAGYSDNSNNHVVGDGLLGYDDVAKRYGLKLGGMVYLKEGAKQFGGGEIKKGYEKYEYKLERVRADGRAVLSLSGIVMYAVGASDLLDGEKIDANKVPYLVRITDGNLNIRSGPGVQYSKVGAITDRGVYTIVEESVGWGKLKSGRGWISLEYTSKV